MTDPIADLLTRIRNAQQAGHRIVDVPASKIKRAIVKILKDKGYIQNFLNIEDGKQGLLRLSLKYDNLGQPTIKEIVRVSTPGHRKHSSSTEIPRIKNGLGISIISTSKGVMTDKEARTYGVGGEVLCYVY
ncbi:MAG: 30S ribosomal protein S8 [Bacteroidetes bacterium]|jgi:small subunit ribosomal protein S8|nr:30S ribosomal protein S8 [Bacteroidota bacterium]NCQ10584.1 30S ribosomal protein S8 [Bacteroidota bacterium]